MYKRIAEENIGPHSFRVYHYTPVSGRKFYMSVVMIHTTLIDRQDSPDIVRAFIIFNKLKKKYMKK